MDVAADFNPERLAGQAFKRRGVSGRGPEFQFCIARRAELQEIVVATVVELEGRDGLRMAAIEAFRETQNRGQRAHRPPHAAPQAVEALVPPLWRLLTMVARYERNRLDFVGLESAEIAVLDEVVRVLVVAFVADVDADIVQDCGVLEPIPLAVGQAVYRARLVEQAHSESRDLVCMVGPEVAAFGELEHAPAADVGVAIRLRDLLAVARDVVQHEAFAQRQVAERDLAGAEASDDRVEQNGAGDGEIRPARFETGHPQALFEIEGHQLPAQPPELLGRHAGPGHWPLRSG